MSRLFGILALAGSIVLGCGCGSVPAGGELPKTLLVWAEAKPKEPEKEPAPGKSGKGANGGNGEKEGDEKDNEKPDAEDKVDDKGDDSIVTDRPDFTEASSTVGLGRVQLEGGYTFSTDRRAGVRRRGHSYPELLLRAGLLAEWFEVRVGQNLSSEVTRSGGTRERVTGAEDLYLGVKLALTEQDHELPETALILQTTAPTGARSLRAGRWLPGVNFLYGWDVVEDALAVGGSLQANRAVTEDGRTYLEVAQSLTVGYTLTEQVGAYTEWFAFYPSGASSPGVSPQHYFNGGFTFLVTDDVQFDIRAGVGLNRAADDFFTGVGFAVRY